MLYTSNSTLFPGGAWHSIGFLKLVAFQLLALHLSIQANLFDVSALLKILQNHSRVSSKKIPRVRYQFTSIQRTF
jgi:hypothetical protein